MYIFERHVEIIVFSKMYLEIARLNINKLITYKYFNADVFNQL